MPDLFYVGVEWNPDNGRTGKPVFVDLDEIAHVTLQGPTGTGKGATVENPNRLMEGLRNCNIIGVDPTGQNRSVSGRWRGTFSDLYRLEPFYNGEDDGGCKGCNPMLSVEDVDDAMRLAEAIEEVPPTAHEPFFGQASQGLIGGVVLGVKRVVAIARKETPTLPMAREVLTTQIEEFAEMMSQHGSYELKSLLTIFQKEGRTIDSIKMHSHNATKWMLSGPVRKFLSVKQGEGMDWTLLTKGKRPLTVDLILPIDKIVTHAPLMKVLVVDALNTLYRIGTASDRKTVFNLSEFASYGRVQPIITALGAGRKVGIRLAPIVIQDSGQLEAIYGKASATTVIGNSGCLIAFRPAPTDNATAAFLSEAAGTHWVADISASDDRNGGPAQIRVGMREERIWTPDKIKRLPRFHALVFREGFPVQPVYCPPYWEIPALRGRYDTDKYHPSSSAKARPGRKMMAASLAAAAVIGGGLWLAHATPPAHVSPSPVVRADPPKENPRAGGSQQQHKPQHQARR
jgi:type IV secretory pathway TraG/TraD family ATPase VirD4